VTAELLAGYLAGEREAAARLFERFRGELLRRARRHPLMGAVSRVHTPEDVAQDVLTRALRADLFTRYQDRGPGTLGALLGVVLTHTLEDHARRLGALKHGGGELPTSLDASGDDGPQRERLAAPQPSPSAEVRATDVLERSRRLLEPHEWDLWRLLEVDGLRPEDIAGLVGRTSASVRGVLFRARLKLVAGLRDLEPGRGGEHGGGR
jgi:DNA-directed RNA polymerase specialized sigma24 family protein